ncbi:bacteriorhodopsin [Halobaculum sp. MBLA0147]|uniref:bacteriorhodopsin n=1 Tax=Halobaculum sp. MBLA0147 TaxID=3079934 RepID=UPI003525D3DF
MLGGRTERVPLAVGTVAMLLGMTYFLVRGWDARGEEREYYAITIMVPAIASAAYLSMFFGFGLTEVEVVGRGTVDIYWARYADWLFTTPLLLLDLCLLAKADRTTIGTLIAVDGFMIVTGLVGALSNTAVERYTWWTVSTVSFLFILYYLYRVLGARIEEADAEVASTFGTLRTLTAVLWTVYPILWIVGTEGAGVVPLFAETTGFTVLDVTAKVGFGYLLLTSRAVTSREQPTTTEGATAAADD